MVNIKSASSARSDIEIGSRLDVAPLELVRFVDPSYKDLAPTEPFFEGPVFHSQRIGG